MADPVKAVLDVLRTPGTDLMQVLDVFSGDAAIFRTEVPGRYKESEDPYIVVDPLQPFGERFVSTTGEAQFVHVPVRLFAVTQGVGDAELSAAALHVRKLFNQTRYPIAGAVLIHSVANYPSEVPAGDSKLSGRRVLVEMQFQEPA